ncbi:Twitchin, partial [Stegodyphus mimosarum]
MPDITWYHGTKKIKDGKRHKIQQQSKGADTYLLSLEIRDPVAEDGGNYRCNAINDLGESNANIALNFQGAENEKGEGLAPEFLEKPKIIPKEGGKLIIMQCKVKAKPAPKITWYQGTKLVKETNRVQAKVIEGAGDEFTVSLEVRDPSKDDGGAYKCHMINEHGELNANLNLDIQAEKPPAGEAPTFVEKPKIIPEDGGNRIIMECKVRASPKPDIKWTCDGADVRESTRIKQTIKQDKDVYHIKLELKNLEFTDAGLYKCNVKNVHGESNANLTLNIELAPVIKEKPKIIKKEIHKKVVIECRVASVSKPTCTWFKESSMVSESSKHTVRITEVTKGEFAVALEIDKPTGEDKGNYKMVAKNEKGEITSTAVQVDIEEEKKEEKKKPTGEKPKIVQGLKSITVESGKSAEFTCKIESKTKTTVTWYKGTQVIKESKEVKMSFDGSVASMTIVQTTTTSSGSYKVEFVNEFGKAESSAELNVEEKKKVEEKKEEKKEEKEVEKKEEKIEKKEEKKEEKVEKKVEKKEEKKVEKKEEKKVEKKEEKIEKKETLKVEKKEEVKVEKKEQKVEKKESLKVEKKEEKKVEEKKVTKQEATKKAAVPAISVEETPEPKGKMPQVPVVIKEPSPEPGSRKGSTDVSAGFGRRGSYVDVPSPGGSRRGSIIIADEKGIVVDETGKTKKLRPGEVLEVQTQKRRRSIDVRRVSVSELQEMIDKPCSPLRPIPETEKCAPSIIDFQQNYSAVEGATAYLSFQVEGNPAPQFHFYKGISEIFEGGRYKIFTDGNSNTVALCIRKAKAQDEGKYKIVAYNEVGEDSQEVSLFVSDESGMDFRAMLKKRQYAKWKEDQQDPDWNLKPPEKERRPSLRETKKKDEFVKPLVDSRAKEGKDKKLRLEAVFSKMNVKAKWYKGKEELFLGKKYHMQSEGDLHVLVINNPTVEDSGRYKIECMGISSSCIVEVDEPDPVYKFVKKLPDTTEAYTTKDVVLECAVNDYKAIVTWYKDGQKIEASDKYVIEADPLGRKLLKIVDLKINDSGQYLCKINAEEKTETKLVVTEQQFKFTKPLKSIRVTENQEVKLECELDDWEGKVQWFKNDKELKPDPVIEQVAEIRRRKLVFKGVRLSDEGKYTCKSNADSTVCEMIVEPANKIVKKLKDCTLLERSKGVLEVEMLDKKAPVEWFKNGEPIIPTDRVHIKMYDDGKHHLIFTTLQMDDAGEYTCQAKDLKTSCKLTVEQAERAPVIKLEKFDFVGDAGKPYTIEVPYEIIGTRTSKAVAKLLRNGQAVTPKEVDIVVKDEKVLITFRKALRGQTGKYHFSLSNSQGEAECVLDVNIQDVPTPPEGPLEVFDVYRDRCKLKWKPCKDTGGMPLKHYVIERQDLGARGGWAEVATTEDTKFDVTDLTPKKEYKFRVR